METARTEDRAVRGDPGDRFDGWLIYIQRVSYIENVLLLIIVGAFLLYQRALDKPSWHRFALAGLVLALAAIFKQTGTYALIAVLLCWLITRRAHKGHLVLLGVAVAVIVAYIVAMHRMYDLPGRPWFTNQSLVQVRRVLGLQQSGGTLTSPGALVHLLEAQYRYFVPSVLVGLSALVLALRRLAQCYKARSWEPAEPNALLYSWMVSGVVIFGFQLAQVPAVLRADPDPRLPLCVDRGRPLGSEQPAEGHHSRGGGRRQRRLLRADPACLQLQHAAPRQRSTRPRTSRPTAVVVTEQSIGDLINQSWCTVKFAAQSVPTPPPVTPLPGARICSPVSTRGTPRSTS